MPPLNSNNELPHAPMPPSFYIHMPLKIHNILLFQHLLFPVQSFANKYLIRKQFGEIGKSTEKMNHPCDRRCIEPQIKSAELSKQCNQQPNGSGVLAVSKLLPAKCTLWILSQEMPERRGRGEQEPIPHFIWACRGAKMPFLACNSLLSKITKENYLYACDKYISH